MVARLGNLILFILALLGATLVWVMTVQWPFGVAGSRGVAETSEFWPYEILLSPVVGYLFLALALPLIIKEFVVKKLATKVNINAWFLVISVAFVVLANLVIGEALG